MMAVVAPPSGRSDPWLTELYRSRYRDLVRLAALLVDDVGLAEEVVQDAFVATARQRERRGLDDVAAAPAYLRTAVLNGARSALRRRRTRRRHLAAAPPPPTAPPADVDVGADADAARILAALGRLSPRQREVLVLRYWEDLSEAEIARTLGVSAGSVKTHAHRGLAALAAALEEAP